MPEVQGGIRRANRREETNALVLCTSGYSIGNKRMGLLARAGDKNVTIVAVSEMRVSETDHIPCGKLVLRKQAGQW